MTNVHDDKKRRRRHLTDLKVTAISLCALGANQGARVALWKSAEAPPAELCAVATVTDSAPTNVAMSVDELIARIEAVEAETYAITQAGAQAEQERDEARAAIDRPQAIGDYEALILDLTRSGMTRGEAAERVLDTEAGREVYARLR